MNGAEFPLFIIALRDSFQGFDMPDIETDGGSIGVLPAIGSEQQARMAIQKLSKSSGLLPSAFRICRYELTNVLEG